MTITMESLKNIAKAQKEATEEAIKEAKNN